MTESLSCHQKKYFNDFPSGMSCRLCKELSKGQGQMAQFVNKAVNQSTGSQENCCKQFFLFLLSCDSSVILKDPQDSGQAHVPPMNPGNPVFSCLPFFSFTNLNTIPWPTSFLVMKSAVTHLLYLPPSCWKEDKAQRVLSSGTTEFHQIFSFFDFINYGGWWVES